MFFSEIDLFPRSEGRGLNLALVKHGAILVSRTTFFSGQSPPASRPAAPCKTITYRKFGRIPIQFAFQTAYFFKKSKEQLEFGGFFLITKAQLMKGWAFFVFLAARGCAMYHPVPTTSEAIDAGRTISDSLQSAAPVRLRPILMTAMTTIFALLPVAVNPAVGSRIFQPFAITVIGGMLSSTAATLVLVPALRTFLSRRRQ